VVIDILRRYGPLIPDLVATRVLTSFLCLHPKPQVFFIHMVKQDLDV
jgi:hypothetical protein